MSNIVKETIWTASAESGSRCALDRCRVDGKSRPIPLHALPLTCLIRLRPPPLQPHVLIRLLDSAPSRFIVHLRA